MLKIILGVFAYVVATFGAQATSHFIVNADHYNRLGFMRDHPIFVFGFLSMFIQGGIFTHLFRVYRPDGASLKQGWLYGLLIAPLIASYSAFAEPAKYMIPDVPSWIMVEVSAAFVQYSLFGILLALIFRNRTHGLPDAV